MKPKHVLVLAVALYGLFAVVEDVSAQGTAFTYQGRLNSSGNPASGNYDFTFSLFNNSGTNSGQIGSTLTILDVGVTNGLFTVALDFGGVFTGNATWLAISVRTNGGESFTALNPLQELMPTPYAIYTPNAGAALTANSATSAISAAEAGVASVAYQVSGANIVGPILNSSLPSNPVFSGTVTANAFSGNGDGLTNLSATNLTGIIPAANLPSSGVTFTGNVTNISPQPVQYGLASFVAGLKNLNQFSYLIASAWFGAGQNYVTPTQYWPQYNISAIVNQYIQTNNQTGLPTYAGIALNCVQSNTGLYLNGTNSCIIFSNIMQQTGPMTLMVFFTPQGWNNAQVISDNGFMPGCFCNTNYSSGSLLGLSVGSAHNGVDVYPGTGSLASSPCSTLGLYYCGPAMQALSTDGTNLSYYEWGTDVVGGVCSWNSNYSALTNFSSGTYNQIVLGEVGLYPPSSPTGPMCGIIHGFIAISNYLSLAQVQQLFTLCQNTVLPWRTVVFEGDSLCQNLFDNGNGFNSWIYTNSPFWGNCVYGCSAIGGTTLEEINARFYPSLAPVIIPCAANRYPGIVLFWGGLNSLAIDSLADLEAGLTWEVQAVHGCGSLIYLSTICDSIDEGTNESKRIQLKSWLLTNGPGADGIVDNDSMYYNLFGTNYYTNLTYFDGVAHPTSAGNVFAATNFAAVVGTNLFAPAVSFACPR
jgi:hypothetical protein